MIILMIANIVVLIIGTIFSWLPVVETLPTIGGYDIDAGLLAGMGYFNNFTTTFWPLGIMFTGFKFLVLYYIIKMVLKFFIGHRTPGH